MTTYVPQQWEDLPAQTTPIEAASLTHIENGIASAMRTDNNLSDLTSVTTARTNLGLGALASKNTVGSADITDGSITTTDLSPTAGIVMAQLAVNPLARANHTGTQTASTISDLAASVIPFTPIGTVSSTTVQAAIAEVAAEAGGGGGGGIPPGTMGANSILKADVADTPIGLTVAPSTFIGRGAAGAVSALSGAQAKTILGITSADITGMNAAAIPFTPVGTISSTDVQSAIAEVAAEAGGGGIPPTLLDAQTVLGAVVDDTPIAIAVPASTLVGRGAAGNVTALTPTQAKGVLNIVPADVSGFDVQVRTNRVDQMASSTATTIFGAPINVQSELLFTASPSPATNWVRWPAASATGNPTFTTRSIGTRMVYYPSISGTTVDYATGCGAGSLWNSVPDGAGQFLWFAATTSVGSLSGAGDLWARNTIGAGIGQSATGTVRLPKNATINFRNNAGTADLSALSTTASETLLVGVPLNLNGLVATNGATPVNPTDVAIKSYVDSVASGGGIPPSTLTANSILKADAAATPLALSVGASTIVGRGAAGNISALTAAQTKTILAIVPADVTGFDTQVQTSRLDQMATPTAAVSLGGQVLTNLGVPANPNDAATKTYVDGLTGSTLTGTTTTAKTFLGVGAGAAAAGADNVVMGYQALNAADSTTLRNVAIGCQALKLTAGASAFDNVAIGYQAGGAMTNAAGNVLVGRAAGGALTTGSSNTFVGPTAGDAYTTGSSSVAIGYKAGHNVTTGGDNTFIGYQADGTVAATSFATAIGENARASSNTTAVGYNAKTGSGVGGTSIGYNAGFGLSSGANNTLVGYQSGRALTTQADNTIIGYNAGQVVTSANNTIVGSTAGTAVTSGGGNTLMGFQAGKTTNTGANNTMIGYNAGLTNAGGANNVFIGAATGYYATAGNSTFVGSSAGGAVTSGANNTLIGFSSGANLTTGGDNTLAGNNAGLNLTTNTGITCFGSGAGKDITTSVGVTAVGYQAGSGGATADRGTAVGYQAGVGITNTDWTMIGYGATGGGGGTAVGASTNAGAWATALGWKATATNGGVALGCDNTGNGATTAVANEFKFGTANHRYNFPGQCNAALNMGSQKITNLATPTVSTDAATMGYVDGKVGGYNPAANLNMNGYAVVNAGYYAATNYIQVGNFFPLSGAVRIPNNSFVTATNAANTTDMMLIGANSSNQVCVGNSSFGTEIFGTALGFFGVAPAARDTGYTVGSYTPFKAGYSSGLTLTDCANALSTIVTALKSYGLLG